MSTAQITTMTHSPTPTTISDTDKWHANKSALPPSGTDLKSKFATGTTVNLGARFATESALVVFRRSGNLKTAHSDLRTDIQRRSMRRSACRLWRGGSVLLIRLRRLSGCRRGASLAIISGMKFQCFKLHIYKLRHSRSFSIRKELGQVEDRYTVSFLDL